MQSHANHATRLRLIMRLIVGQEQMMRDIARVLDKKRPAVKRGKKTKFVKPPLIVVRFDSSDVSGS
jgi:hypothetical protein